MDVEGVALVIGAGSGIGRVVAYTLAKSGISTLLCADINVSQVQDTAMTSCTVAKNKEIYQAGAFQVDVHQELQVQMLFSEIKEEYGRIDICVSTAGTDAGSHTPISEMCLDTYRSIDKVHSIECFLVLREVIRAMTDQEPVSQRRGSIILLTSLYSGVGNSIAAKYAVSELVRTAALENTQKGIRINAVRPSYASEPMMHNVLNETSTDLTD
ncbi:hypothetical protein BBP40_001988 [Aspergillus hancockii]|nr:hypothetical protein BBP40_001988 [Aspergillus hancockii]